MKVREFEKDYMDAHELRLRLIHEMWNDPMVQCYDDANLPAQNTMRHGSVFLYGPTSRNYTLMSNWRCQAVRFIRTAGFKGWIYVPELRGFGSHDDFTDKGFIHTWESKRGMSATKKAFWIPRNSGELLGLNTNLELGIILGLVIARKVKLKSVFVGWPDNAERMGLPRHYTNVYAKLGHYKSLEAMAWAIAGKKMPLLK